MQPSVGTESLMYSFYESGDLDQHSHVVHTIAKSGGCSGFVDLRDNVHGAAATKIG